ncbi:glutathione peroxidase [Candidatus Venteria ishoeyi]|uniref:Glutathione amide-dependent peroxidase n=1 Tax=Candidatus Venteria ishoeyi TaxID=1899563 RepID=A0A1H6FCB6_9GAMM|nr:glutathione peroxidase [Candidatus Venteria ishoeyi]MDM8547141.1 glutathione peroxidase [Candidatus Venteria ishoeyi]SEH06796.1 Glutathione amide-dependent peroxidase [Candidatus Venteria ishoeyi]
MFKNLEGQRIPSVVFKVREGVAWKDVNSDDLFQGKTVILFSLPGAFTPTCSGFHVPCFNELAPVFFENGVDDIICLSVNDSFVMQAWQLEQQADHIRFIPDGNGEFSQAMGMLADKQELGFGQRAWRYSMLVKDGIIEKMFIETEDEDVSDPYIVSDAETMLNHINPNAHKPIDIAIFTKKGCPYCAKTKDMLSAHDLAYEEMVLGEDYSLRALRTITNAKTVPQVYINGLHIGGSEALEAWFEQRKN